jgi:hypothetical protein
MPRTEMKDNQFFVLVTPVWSAPSVFTTSKAVDIFAFTILASENYAVYINRMNMVIVCRMLISLNCPADADSPVKERLVGKDSIFQVELVFKAVVSHLQKKPTESNLELIMQHKCCAYKITKYQP